MSLSRRRHLVIISFLRRRKFPWKEESIWLNESFILLPKVQLHCTTAAVIRPSLFTPLLVRLFNISFPFPLFAGQSCLGQPSLSPPSILPPGVSAESVKRRN